MRNGGFLADIMKEIIKYRISSIEVPVAGTKVLRMEPLDGRMLGFVPGQWVFMHLLDKDGKSTEKRPYSIASAPSAPCLEFCIEIRGGAFTSRLDKVGTGTVVGIQGPQGRMTYNGEKKAAFIAGGTGISPVLSMLRHIAENGLAGEFVLFYSVRTRDKLLYKDELERLVRKNPRIKTVITLTRETPARGWMGECGRVGHEMILKHSGRPAEYDWWMCGPMEMVASMRTCLAGMGVDQKKIRLETWG